MCGPINNHFEELFTCKVYQSILRFCGDNKNAILDPRLLRRLDYPVEVETRDICTIKEISYNGVTSEFKVFTMTCLI